MGQFNDLKSLSSVFIYSFPTFLELGWETVRLCDCRSISIPDVYVCICFFLLVLGTIPRI